MCERTRDDFRTRELDPALLSTPFRVQTNWQVITGAPCCGKTTLVDQLAARGFQTVPETARLYMDQEIAKGRTLHELRGNRDALQRGILDMQVRIESGLRATDVVFLDRGVPDCLAWNRALGLELNESLRECFHHRYASVFMLDPLPFREDGTRDEDAAKAGYLDEWLTRDYSALGYQIVRVPAISIQERLEFVLERLSEQELNS
jgi:predicted ATPase